MDKSSLPARREYFDSKERVRLMFLLKDLFPIPQQAYGVYIRGAEWHFLYEGLQRKLGRKEIGYGFEVVGAVEDFINRAAEDELLTMLELVPSSYIAAFEKMKSIPDETPNKRELQRIISSINSFLSRIGSPARFASTGRFIRGGFADETPPALKNLPDREQLRSDVQTLKGENPTAAVVFIDLDDFKAVNDQQGHAAGDRCLEIVASAVGATVAYKGKLYRYGGDELVVVLPNFTASEAVATAERIRKEIERTKPGGTVKVTASIGVAASDIDGMRQDRLIESADAAMYASKNSTKNCVTVWAQGMVSVAH